MARTSILLLFASLCLPSPSFAAPPVAPVPSEFAFCAPVQGSVAAASLYQVPLREELIKASRSTLDDLRVFDGANREIPFVVIANIPPHETVESYPMEITGYDRDGAEATVLLKLPEKHRPISMIDLDVADRDFKKRVTLSGSGDGKSWSRLTEDTIFDFSSQVAVRRTRIEFPASPARYFRLTLAEPHGQAEGQTGIKLKYEGLDFTVSGAQTKELRIRSARGVTGDPAEKYPVYDEDVVRTVVAMPDKDGNSVVTLPGGVPIDRLSFDVANPYFSRTVQLWGSDTGEEDSYRLLASGNIYRFPLSSEQREERDTMEPHVSKHGHYRVVVLNRNDPPLRIQGLTLSWVQQNLYFVAPAGGEQYSLCYGNSKVGHPEYDLVNFVNRNTLSQHAFRSLELGPAQAGSGVPTTLGDRVAGIEKPVLRAIVALLVVGMGIWLYRLMRKTGRE